MARIANLQKRSEEQTALIWRRLIDYANDDASEKEFKELVELCFETMGGSDSKGVLEECGDLKTHSFADLAVRYRKPMRGVMRWLIGPEEFPFLSLNDDETDPALDFVMLATDAVRFLQKHYDSFQVEYHPAIGLDHNTETSTVALWRRFTSVGSVITGVCHFILEQVDRHDLNGEPIAKVFPFGICERDGCGHFFLVQRVGRGRFCSDGCRSLAAKAKQSPEEKAAYMKRYRAAKALQESRAQRAKQRQTK